jgi:hypothetical protein
MSDIRTLGSALAKQVGAKLAELQGERTDAQMAAILGCSRQHYWRIKKGQKFPSYAMAKRAGAVFPEVRDLIILDLIEVPA